MIQGQFCGLERSKAVDSCAQNVEQDHYNKLFSGYESNGQPANRSKQNFKYLWLASISTERLCGSDVRDDQA